VGGLQATIVSWTHTLVTAKVPAGEGKDLDVIFYSGDQTPLAQPELTVSLTDIVL
jgi:hypothetical protein